MKPIRKSKITPVRLTGAIVSSRASNNIKDIKKMNFFKRWLIKLTRSNDESYGEQIVVSNEHSIDQPDRAIRFTVYIANGGRVVETHRYDRKNDRSHQNLYVITDDKEFGKEIDKIITMESLR